MSRAFEAATARRAELRRELARVEAFLADLAHYEGKPQSDPPTTGNSTKEQVAQACADAIRQAGHPLSRQALLSAVRQRGLTVEGKDSAMVLSTMLHRSQSLVFFVKSRGYWLTGTPLHPA